MEGFPLLRDRRKYSVFFLLREDVPALVFIYESNFNLLLTNRQLNVPSCLTLLPGQLQMLKEVVDKERSRRRARTPSRAPPSPLSVPLVGEIPP